MGSLVGDQWLLHPESHNFRHRESFCWYWCSVCDAEYSRHHWNNLPSWQDEKLHSWIFRVQLSCGRRTWGLLDGGLHRIRGMEMALLCNVGIWRPLVIGYGLMISRAILGAILFVALWLVLPRESPIDREGKVDWIGACLGICALILFNFVWK